MNIEDHMISLSLGRVWVADSLGGLLKNQPCSSFCPDEVAEVIEKFGLMMLGCGYEAAMGEISWDMLKAKSKLGPYPYWEDLMKQKKNKITKNKSSILK